MATINLLLVDDSQQTLEALKSLLEMEKGIAVVGMATDGVQAVAKSIELKPDVVLMDVKMPGFDGIEATRRIKRESCQTSVILLSMYDNDNYVSVGIEAGASTYVLKGLPAEELATVIRRVARREPVAKKYSWM